MKTTLIIAAIAALGMTASANAGPTKMKKSTAGSEATKELNRKSLEQTTAMATPAAAAVPMAASDSGVPATPDAAMTPARDATAPVEAPAMTPPVPADPAAPMPAPAPQ